MLDLRSIYPKVEWDLTTNRINGALSGKKGDTGRGMEIYLVRNGAYVVPTTEILNLKYSKEDGTSGYVGATLETERFFIENTSQVFAIAGKVTCEFELVVEDEFIKSNDFVISSLESKENSGIESTNEYTVIQEFIIEANSIKIEFEKVKQEVGDRPLYHYVTQAEYDALTLEQKADKGHMYEITDTIGEYPSELQSIFNDLVGGYQPVYKYVTQAEYDALSPQQKADNKYIYEITDDASDYPSDLQLIIDDLVEGYDPRLKGLESQLAEKSSQTALEVEKARINSFTALAAGSTTGDAELIDARVGADGTTYANAGGAVRGQADVLKDKLLNFKLTNYAENTALSLANEEKTIPVVIASAHNGVLKYSVKNTSVNDGYFRVQFLKGASVIYSKEQLILKNSTVTETVALTLDVDAIYLKNINARTITFNCWVEYVDDFFKVLNKSDFIVDANGKGDFTTIQAALTFLKSSFDVANIPVRLRIRNGKYTATPSEVYPYYALDKGANKISIIGESRDGVIINCLCTSALKGLALNIGGECTIENLTINVLADAGLTVESLNTANFRPYCIHNDESPLTVTDDYYTTVKNCKLYNEVYMPVGAGLQNKQTQRYETVECIFKSLLENRQGSLYVHSPSNPASVANGIEVIDCVLVAYNGATALHLPNVVGSQQYSAIKQTFVRNATASTGASEVWNPTPNKTIVSKGNSNASLNV